MTATSPRYRGDVARDHERTSGLRAVRTFTETKVIFKTSEFMVWLASVVGVLIVTYSDGSGSLSNRHGWLLITVLSAAYMFSRGIAKSGSREPYTRNVDVR